MTTTKELKEKLNELCDRHNTNKNGINYLVNYYIYNLGWSEEQALEYAIKLFENETIDEIKIIA